jgi:hypothetical protein
MKERQVSFSGGVLSPSLYGRTDISRYATGARTLRNFFVSPAGVAMNRPGTQHVTDLGAHPARLIPFVVSESESYVLVFVADSMTVAVWRESESDGRHLFSKSGTIALFDPGAPTALYEYSAAELSSMRWAQSGPYLTVCAEGRYPLEIKYTSASSWSAELLDLTAEVFPTQNGAGFEQRYPRMHFADEDEKLEVMPVDEDGNETEDTEYPRRYWRWHLTWVIRRAKDKKLYETRGYWISSYHIQGRR